MNYELVTVVRPNSSIWSTQQQRLANPDTQLLSISPMPDFNKVLSTLDITGTNILDELTMRTHDADGFLFFNQIPTVKNAEIFMNENRSISILHDGFEIGKVFLYPQTRRHVKEVRYLHLDKTIDYVEEYAADGKKYSQIFYHNNQVQAIHFLNDDEQSVVTYHFYQGQINFVTIQDPETLIVKERFSTLAGFIAYQVAKKVTPQDTITISYLGMELFALEKTNSYNILYLTESPLDDKGQIKGNLRSILENRIPYVHKVMVTPEQYAQLSQQAINLNKVEQLKN